MSHNPPAFPVPNDANVNGQEGMSLRDYFAGQALAGYFAAPNTYHRNATDCADYLYQMADAMLAAREPKDTTTAQQIALGIGGGE